MFALPLRQFQQPSLDKHALSVTTKRKRGKARKYRGSENEITQSDETLATETSRFTHSRPHTVLTPDERTQRWVAGLPPDEELPISPFPHAPISSRTNAEEADEEVSDTTSEGQNEGKALKPARASTLRMQHLSAMTTILHRCLMEHDYPRARRALGLIMREQVGGHEFDIRSEGRWGIGAEILLRQGVQWNPGHGNLDTDSSKSSAAWFTRQGLEDAKEYYRRLVIQYPFHKSAPNSINALDFYPAMFGLWIYVAHEECKMQLDLFPDDDNNDDDAQMSQSLSSVQHLAAKRQELEQAQEIGTEMDKAMISYPYSDDAELLRLRGMVAQWTADLQTFCAEEDEDDYSRAKTADYIKKTREVAKDCFDKLRSVHINE